MCVYLFFSEAQNSKSSFLEYEKAAWLFLTCFKYYTTGSDEMPIFKTTLIGSLKKVTETIPN